MIKCLVVDDEHLAREAVKAYIEKTPELALVGECENAGSVSSSVSGLLKIVSLAFQIY